MLRLIALFFILALPIGATSSQKPELQLPRCLQEDDIVERLNVAPEAHAKFRAKGYCKIGKVRDAFYLMNHDAFTEHFGISRLSTLKIKRQLTRAGMFDSEPPLSLHDPVDRLSRNRTLAIRLRAAGYSWVYQVRDAFLEMTVAALATRTGLARTTTVPKLRQQLIDAGHLHYTDAVGQDRKTYRQARATQVDECTNSVWE